MDNVTALKLAIKQVERRISQIAVNANLHDDWGLDTPAGRNAARERKRLKQAIEVLTEISKEGEYC